MFYGVLCNNGPAHRLREGDFIQEHPGLLRRLERIICGKHYALMSQWAMVQLSGSAEHMPDVVTRKFSLK